MTDTPATESDRFAEERSFWSAFKSGLDADAELASQVSGAVAEANRRYDTAIYENRFIVGGITEQVVGSAARALGLDIRNAAKALAGVDLRLPGGGGVSVKAVYSKSFSSVRLINTLGGKGSTRTWDEATIFVIRDHGVGYADPQLLTEATTFSGDALELKSKMLLDLWAARPALLCSAVHVARKPDAATNPRVASDVVSHDLLMSYSRLSRHWQAELS